MANFLSCELKWCIYNNEGKGRFIFLPIYIYIYSYLYLCGFVYAHICVHMYVYIFIYIYMHIHHIWFYIHACIHIVCIYIHTCTIGSFESVASINLALIHEHMMQCVHSRVSSKLSPARVSNFQGPVLAVVGFRCWLWSSTWTAQRSCRVHSLQSCSIKVQLHNHCFSAGLCKLRASVFLSVFAPTVCSCCFAAGLDVIFLKGHTVMSDLNKAWACRFFVLFCFYWKSMRETTSKLGLCICTINKRGVLGCSAGNC